MNVLSATLPGIIVYKSVANCCDYLVINADTIKSIQFTRTIILQNMYTFWKLVNKI